MAMRNALYSLGVLLFVLGMLLVVTYSPANCGGVTCMLPPLGPLSTGFGKLPPQVQETDGSFTFTENYSLKISSFALVVGSKEGVSWEVNGKTLVIRNGGEHNLSLVYTNGTLRVLEGRGENLKVDIEGVLFVRGLTVEELELYDDPGAYLQFWNCSRNFEEVKRRCEEGGSPRYQPYAGLALMLLGLATFGMGMRAGKGL